MDGFSEWKIFICCIISSLLTGILTTYVNKRLYETQHQSSNHPKHSNPNHIQQTTNKFASHSNNKNNHQKLPIPPAPKNIPSTTATLSKQSHSNIPPQTYITSPNNNKNGLLSHSHNSHSEHLNLINQVVTSYPDQIGRKISIESEHKIQNSIEKENNKSVIRERIVIVSYKLPIIITKDINNANNKWNIEFENEMSFLSNLRILSNSNSNKNKYEIVFVGWPGIYLDNREDIESLEDALLLCNYKCYPIFLSYSQVELAYDIFCKTILWPSFHYQMGLNDNGEFGLNYQISWKSYCDLNCKYAKKSLVAACDNIELENSYIWFHDYHLLMAAQFVKKDNYICKCGLFLHTVFPTSEVFRCLPTRKEILRGMLSNDLIGFHTYDYCRHFLSSCKRILNLNFHTLPNSNNIGGLAIHYLGRDIALRVSHIGIRSNYIKNKVLQLQLQKTNLSKYIKNKKVENIITNICKKRKLIISMGSNDIIHGTLYNLKAYNIFLNKSHKSWRNEICFVQILYGSSYSKSKYKNTRNKTGTGKKDEIKQNILTEISIIQTKYNNNCILLIEDQITYLELIILFRFSDIGLFGTFWEGFNCGPYEYTASQTGKQIPGALIISEFMGCHRSLSGVFRINPFDYELVANTLQTSLIMTTEERRISHYRRYKHVMKYTFFQWAQQFIIDMKKSQQFNNQNSLGSKMVQFGLGSNLRLMYIQNSLKKLKCDENIYNLQNSFKKCKKRMLLFDFHGTLTDQYYEDNPNEFFSTTKDSNFKQIINYLSILSLDPKTYVGIISGAGCKELEIAFKHCNNNIILCSEKGAFWKWQGMEIGKWEKNTSLNDDIISSWKQIAYDTMKIYCDKCDGSYIQCKSTALIWHYFLCDPEYGAMQAVELERYLKRLLSFQFNNVAFQSYDHSMLLEILPKNIHKGTAAMTILNNIITQIEYENNCDEKNYKFQNNDIFMLSVGNDRSDEKMFEAIELAKDNLNANDNVFTISIGLKPTQSQYYISKQIDMIWLLKTLCNSLPNYNNNNNINHSLIIDNKNQMEIQQSQKEMKYMISKLLKKEQEHTQNNNKLSLDINQINDNNFDEKNDCGNDNIKTPQIDHLTSE